MGVKAACKPRSEVLKGDLDDTIFAADFGHLIAGDAPKVYKDAKTLFRNTHPAGGLCRVVRAIFGRLADAKEGGITLRLSTGFGGGKTHTLMALWHLANNIADHSLGTELLPAAGRPKAVKVVAVDAAKGGLPVFETHGATRVGSLWGEIFWQFGGKKALDVLGKADSPEGTPHESQLKKLFPDGPVLILLDELVIYMAKLSERGQGNLLGFLNSLTSVVSNRPQTALVVTDPAAQAAYAKQAAKIAETLAAATKLDEVFGRKMTDFDPIGDEAPRVIARRLFEKIQDGAAQKASATYLSLYQRVAEEHPGSIPPSAASATYARRILECYPFHPRLLDTAQDRLGSLQDFQKSRGVLRLFARILRDVWEGEDDPELISAGEIDWASSRIQSDLLSRLNRDQFKAAVSADVDRHAGELDGDARRGIYRRAASALLLESLPLTPSSGLDPAELTLAILRPDEAGHEPGEALDRLVGICWHTYPMAGGRGWQFRYEPNVNRLIEERAGKIPLEDAKSRVMAEAQAYFIGPGFKLAPWPANAKQVPESAELQLALCETEKIARAVCAYADDTDPQAPIPRNFQNAMVAVTATAAGLNSAVDRARWLLAAEATEREHKGEAGKSVRDQLARIKPELIKQFRIQTCRAFDRVVLAGGTTYQIEEQYQVSEEQMLQRPQGQQCLRKFLDAKGLLYQPGDALDLGRFLKDVLRGATPAAEIPEAYSVKAIHERFLGAPGLRLLPDAGIVRETIRKAVADGKLVLRLPDGRAFDQKGCVAGEEGSRRRRPDPLPAVPLDDRTYVALATSTAGTAWVREDVDEGYRGKKPVPPPPPPPGPEPTATTIERALELAADRPLRELRLIAGTAALASNLAALAQPFGADSLRYTITTGGNLRDGGAMNFSASDVKTTHATKPLEIAQRIGNALADGGTFEVELVLKFGPAGRSGMRPCLEQLEKDWPDGLRISARFGKLDGGTG